MKRRPCGRAGGQARVISGSWTCAVPTHTIPASPLVAPTHPPPAWHSHSCVQHGEPLGKDELAAVKSAFGFDPAATFVITDDVAAYYRAAAARGAAAAAAWATTFAGYEAAHATKAAEFKRRIAGELPAGWMDKLPRWKATDKPDATR